MSFDRNKMIDDVVLDSEGNLVADKIIYQLSPFLACCTCRLLKKKKLSSLKMTVTGLTVWL